LLAVASALVGALVAFLWMRAPAPSVLHLTDGRDVPPRLETPEVSFDDGSAIEVRSGARLDLLESTARAFSVALRAGTAAFEVHPGGPRVWRVVCGPVTVEVVGTRFTVTRDETKVKVSVQRGAVLVSGEPVPDHVVRLGPTQSIVVRLLPSGAEGAARKEDRDETPRENAPTSSSASAAARSRAALAGSLVAPVPPGSAIPAGSANEAEPPPPVEAMLARADEARLAGRYQDAATILERVVAEDGAAPKAYLAEFSLGRLYLDSLGDPARAATHFSRALMRGLPDALAEDACARLVESYARAGDPAAAHSAAERYRARYAQGRRLRDVDRWSAPTP
jgi:transmembrane sensor